MAKTYVALRNQYNFKRQAVFSARFDKQDEDGQFLDEVEFHISLINGQNLTESDINNIDFISSLQPQNQKQLLKKSGWSFHKISLMTI